MVAVSPKGGRGVLALALLFLTAREAGAERGYQVEITSKPEGATIYFEDGASARIERTPFRGRLTPGSYTVVFELAGHRDEIRDFKVARSRRVQTLSARLERLNPAYLVVETAAAFAGGEVRIDGEERGEAAAGEAEFLVSPGAHLFEVVVDDEVVFSEWVKVEAGGRAAVRAFPEGAEPDDPDPIGAGGAGEGDGDGDAIDASLGASAEPRYGSGSLVTVGVGLEVAGRRFRFKNPEGNFRPYDAGGVPIGRVLAEVFPFGRSENRFLAGFGVAASFGRPVVSVTASTRPEDGSAPEELETKISDFEVGALYRYYLGTDSYAGVSVHYSGQQSEFGELEMSAVAEGVPGVNYRFVRLGADAGGPLGPVVAQAGVAAQQVLDIGDLAGRFENTRVVGVGARAAISSRALAPIEIRLVGSLSHYSLTFTSAAGAPDSAEGGTDLLYGVTLAAFYSY